VNEGNFNKTSIFTHCDDQNNMIKFAGGAEKYIKTNYYYWINWFLVRLDRFEFCLCVQ